jgi:hypothetical protein
MHGFANPGRFLRISGRLLPFCVGLTVLPLGVGLYLGLLAARARALRLTALEAGRTEAVAP